MKYKTSAGFGWPSNWDRLTFKGLDSLLLDIVEKDYVAQQEIMRRYWGLIFKYIFVPMSRTYYICARESAEEIANDTFLKIFIGIQNGKIHKLSKYIMLKATNYAIVDFFRAELGRKGHKQNIRRVDSIDKEFYEDNPFNKRTLLDTLIDPQVDIEEEYIKQERLDLIKQVSYELPFKQGKAFRLYYLNGFTMKQARAVLNVSESRVCQILPKAVEFIKKRMKQLESTDTPL